jgi:hypothetical protein
MFRATNSPILRSTFLTIQLLVQCTALFKKINKTKKLLHFVGYIVVLTMHGHTNIKLGYSVYRDLV